MILVADILVTESDSMNVKETKEYLKKYFVTKDLSQLRYFLGIKVTRGK